MKTPVCFLAGMTAVLLVTSNLYGQHNASAMDSVFNEQLRNGLLMGNLLVAEKGKVVYQRSFGLRDIANNQPNTPASAFGLASISKAFTATAVLQLKEKGKLGLDDRFAHYFPDFPFPDITLRQLLTHTSGLPEYELFDSLAEKEPNRIFTNHDVIPALKLWSKGLYFKPGEGWRYSSMNYCLLALLIEKLSGETLPGYLAKHIYGPAGMQHTYLENLLIKKENPDRTVNYEYPAYYSTRLVMVDSVPDDHAMIFNLGGFSGQGGLTSTTEDLLRFDNAFFSGQLINFGDLAEALMPVTLNNGQVARVRESFADLGATGYGLGWFIQLDSAKGKIVYHDGGRPGISTVHLHNLRTDQTVILLENDAPEDTQGTAVRAYHLLNGEPIQSARIPLIPIYARALVNEGAEAALIKLQLLRDNPAYQMPNDWTWVNLGYQLCAKPEYRPLAIEALKTASLLYPTNWYVDQEFAAVLELVGKKDLAIAVYKKCVAENPAADYAVGRLKALEGR